MMDAARPARTLRHRTLATAGHVDHGKSALVRALTGTDPDRLPEEKKRGITIDLGFAHFDLPAPGETGAILRVGIVDVPGHEDFIKNMVAGVGGVDAALLAVAADDGWMPQTEEHLRILGYAGVTRLVVALTKADLPPSPGALAAVVEDIRARLAGTVYARSEIVPTSIPMGAGLAELRAVLARALAAAPPAADTGKPRLPIDRVFTLRGVGTVVTGTLTGGALGRGQLVAVRPGGRIVRVRSLQSHGRDVESVPPGARAALNLPDLSADPGAPDAPARGDVVTLESIGDGTGVFDALLSAAGASPWKTGAAVRVHLGSGHHAARLRPLDAPGGNLARIRLEAPALVFAGDRFVIRDLAGRLTLGGGVVLDPDPPRHRRGLAAQRVLLRGRATAPGDVVTFVRTALARDGVVVREGLLMRSRFAAGEISATLEILAASGGAFLTPALAAGSAWWQALRERAIDAIDAEHRAHPERPGLLLTQLKAAIASSLPARLGGVFDALVADLTKSGVCVRAGSSIRRFAHRPELPARLQAAGARVRSALLEKPLEPPSRAAVAPDQSTQAALRFLIEAGEVVELGEETVVGVGAFVRLRAGVVRHLRAHGSATASDLRQAVGTTRRVLVPLLERLDRDGVTRRERDLRTLKEVGSGK